MTHKDSTELKLARAGHILTVLAFIVSFLLTGLLTASAETAPLIKMVELRGNRRISTDTISSKMNSKEGAPFSKNTVQEDIRKLYGIGYFDDIKVEIEAFEGGVKLIYVFMEKPLIVSMDFQGNKKLETKSIREKITLTTGAIANMTLITDNAKKIILYYQSEGYWLATVVPVINKVSEDGIMLTYQINEGPKVSIDKINIEGNKAVTDREIKRVMKTAEWWIFSFLTGSGVYNEEQITVDLARIKEFYQSKGYIYMAVSEPQVNLAPDKKSLQVTISISEGDQYRVGSIKVKGNTVIPDAELYEQVKTVPGQIFDRTALKKDIDKIIDLYMNRGYARADVDPLVDVNKEGKTADITLSVIEGGIYRIGRIDVTGNIKTRDKVVRREMRLDEGDIFSKQLLTRSYQRINNLNYFESVDLRPTPKVDTQLVDLDVKVEEKLTGMLSIGGGYSSVDKFMVMGEITQINLFGRGLQLKLKTELSSRRSNYNISLRDPWFMDEPVSASVGIYNEVVDYTDYKKKATGGNIGFSRELSEYVGGSIRYEIEQVDITNVSEKASTFIQDQTGTKLTSSISPSIWRDTRDNILDPTSGSKNALYLTFAGLGGDNHFWKAIVDSGWFFPAMWKTTFGLHGRYGYVSGYKKHEVPLYERFYVGGINTVRGIGFGEGGPVNEEDEKIGGVQELIFNAEYIFPILDEMKLKGVLFYDYGGSFDSSYVLSEYNMRRTAGAGVRWLSPLGPLRLEWGFNLDPREGEENDKVEISIGGLF
ncbi:MAG: outer membrane protein assembly factor BamA [Nitrospirae bacterium]|nr:outer membrane protein assembly factor BamA [Nitrospirota bacterium]